MTSLDPTERFQAAAKEMIGAARAMLDAADDLVDDRERVRELASNAAGFVGDFVDALGKLARNAVRPIDGDGGGGEGADGDDDSAGDAASHRRNPGDRLRRIVIDDDGAAEDVDDGEW